MRISIRIIPAVLFLAACAGTRKSSPEPMMDDHPMHTPLLVATIMMEQEANALKDSAIVHTMRAGVDEWNQGNLDAFLALYDSEATYMADSGPVDARDAIRQIHTTRRIGGGDAQARLSIRLVRTETVADDARRLVIAWTATDAAGRQETWTSSPTLRFTPDVGWRIIREQPLPDDQQRGAALQPQVD